MKIPPQSILAIVNKNIAFVATDVGFGIIVIPCQVERVEDC